MTQPDALPQVLGHPVFDLELGDQPPPPPLEDELKSAIPNHLVDGGASDVHAAGRFGRLE